MFVGEWLLSDRGYPLIFGVSTPGLAFDLQGPDGGRPPSVGSASQQSGGLQYACAANAQPSLFCFVPRSGQGRIVSSISTYIYVSWSFSSQK